MCENKDECCCEKFIFQPPFTMIICGNSGSGKTQLLKQLINTDFTKTSQGFQNIFVFCPSMDYSGDYDEFKHREFFKDRLFDTYDSKIIGEIIESQENIINRYGKKRCPQTLIILDDCLENLSNNPNNNIISKIFFKGRHINLSVVVLVQKLKGIGTLLRINTRYCIFFRCGNSQELENLLEEFTGKRERKIIENELYEHFKNPYSFVVCDFKNQDFKKRYALGQDKKFVKYIEWY